MRRLRSWRQNLLAPVRGGEGSLLHKVARELVSDSPTLATAFFSSIVLTAVVSTALVIDVGGLVGRLSKLGQQSTGIDKADVRLLVGFGLLLIIQQSLAGLQRGIAPTLGRRLEGRQRSRVMDTIMARPTIEHLSDSKVLEKISSATTMGTAAIGPASSVEALVAVSNSALIGAGMVMLVGYFRWWLGVLLACAWLNARHHRRRDSLENWRVMGMPSPVARRQAYFRELGTDSGAAKEIRLFAISSWLLDAFDRYWRLSMEVAWNLRRTHRPSLVVALVGIVVANSVAGVVIGSAAASGSIDLGKLIILVQALLGCSSVADYGPMTVNEVIFAYGASTVTRVDELQSALPQHLDAPGGFQAPRKSALPNGPNRISLENVSFAYPGGNQVFRDLSLTLERGRSLAVVGANGAGKTTLVQLLCGFLAPDSGTIRVDDIPLSGQELSTWRDRIAVVFQDFAHLPMTLRENVRMGAESISNLHDDDELEEVAELAGLQDIVHREGEGWDALLAADFHGGVDLSEGQWQRVALARALYASRQGASLLILDEPTSSLDIRAEAAFFDNFLRITDGMTTVVISHRYATVRQADTICVLENGSIAESGDHAGLMRRKGIYSQLFAVQAASFDDEAADET